MEVGGRALPTETGDTADRLPARTSAWSLSTSSPAEGSSAPPMPAGHL